MGGSLYIPPACDCLKNADWDSGNCLSFVAELVTALKLTPCFVAVVVPTVVVTIALVVVVVAILILV